MWLPVVNEVCGIGACGGGDGSMRSSIRIMFVMYASFAWLFNYTTTLLHDTVIFPDDIPLVFAAACPASWIAQHPTAAVMYLHSLPLSVWEQRVGQGVLESVVVGVPLGGAGADCREEVSEVCDHQLATSIE